MHFHFEDGLAAVRTMKTRRRGRYIQSREGPGAGRYILSEDPMAAALSSFEGWLGRGGGDPSLLLARFARSLPC